MKKPFKTYFGGKEANGVYQTIINHIRPHDFFLEPFGGNFTISRKLNDNGKKIINDISKKNFAAYPGNTKNYCFFNLDYRTFLDRQNIHNHIVIYFDPPYPLDSRKSNKKVYQHEFSNQDHVEFLNYVGSIKYFCDILISTYPNELYKTTLKDWYHVEFEGMDRHGKTTEWLFMNYDPDKIEKLHDARYFGKDRTDRQRIKRFIASNLSKISKMHPVVKNFYLYQVEENFFNGQGRKF